MYLFHNKGLFYDSPPVYNCNFPLLSCSLIANDAFTFGVRHGIYNSWEYFAHNHVMHSIKLNSKLVLNIDALKLQ